MERSPGHENSGDATASTASYSGTEFPITVTDFAGRTTIVDEPPERVVILSGTALNVWYDAGGSAVATTDRSENIRLSEAHAEQIAQVPELGAPYTVSAEAIVALDPDLVLTMGSPQEELAARLNEMGIETLTVKLRSFEDLRTAYGMFGALNDMADHARQRIETIERDADAITEKWPSTDESVAIVFVTAKSLSVKLDNSIAGDMVAELGVPNVASDLVPSNPGAETAPLDIEYLVAHQPDHILITSMISSNEEARARVQEEFDSTPAWQSLTAVREGRVHHLPQQYFLYNAGPYYADAMQFLCATLAPEVYGEPVMPV